MSGFKSSAQNHADHAIHARRNREAALDSMNHHINNDYKLRHKAQWEAKTDTLITKGRVARRANDMQNVHVQSLDQRRQKLKLLLEAEEAQYQSEFASKQEKPEDIRNRMAERLFTLKTAREEQRKDMVAGLYERRWKEGADELRQEGSKLNNLETRIEQQNQMRIRKQKEAIGKEEDMLYNELWKRDYNARVAREQAEANKLYTQCQERITGLNWQTDLRENERQQASQANQDEKRTMMETWTKQKTEADQLDYQRFLQNRQLNNGIISENEAEKRNRNEEYQQELQSDKAMIQALLDKEESDKSRERAAVQALRDEAKEMMGFTSLRAQQDAELEKMIEDHANMEQEKQWQRTEAKWMAEEQARVNLMQDVYDSRYNSILARKTQQEADKAESMADRQRIEAELQEAERKDQEMRSYQRQNRVQHQEDIRFQCTDGMNKRKQDVRQDMHERRAGQLAEMDYLKQINAEKAKNADVLRHLQQQRF